MTPLRCSWVSWWREWLSPCTAAPPPLGAPRGAEQQGASPKHSSAGHPSNSPLLPLLEHLTAFHLETYAALEALPLISSGTWPVKCHCTHFTEEESRAQRNYVTHSQQVVKPDLEYRCSCLTCACLLSPNQQADPSGLLLGSSLGTAPRHPTDPYKPASTHPSPSSFPSLPSNTRHAQQSL